MTCHRCYWWKCELPLENGNHSDLTPDNDPEFGECKHDVIHSRTQSIHSCSYYLNAHSVNRLPFLRGMIAEERLVTSQRNLRSAKKTITKLRDKLKVVKALEKVADAADELARSNLGNEIRGAGQLQRAISELRKQEPHAAD